MTERLREEQTDRKQDFREKIVSKKGGRRQRDRKRRKKRKGRKANELKHHRRS